MAIRNNREFNLFNFPVHVIFFSQTTFNMVDAGRSNLMLVKKPIILGEKTGKRTKWPKTPWFVCILYHNIKSRMLYYNNMLWQRNSLNQNFEILLLFCRINVIIDKKCVKVVLAGVDLDRVAFHLAITDILFIYSYM